MDVGHVNFGPYRRVLWYRKELMMYRIQKTFEVALAHELNLPYISKCKKLHGHNLSITVYCQAEELNENGMVIDFTLIKSCVHDAIDHTSLSEVRCPNCDNLVIESSIHGPDIGGNPTAENLAFWIFTRIDKCYRVDVQESDGNIATYIDDTLEV